MRRRLAHRVGFRGATLLFFAVIDLAYGLSLAFPAEEARRSATARYVDAVLPLQVWAGLWLLVGIICAVYAFRTNDRVGFTAASMLKALWGLVALGGWLVGPVERGWVSAAIWLVMAGWVTLIAYWPEPPRVP